MIRLSFKNILRKKSRTLLIFGVCFIASLNIFIQIAQKNSVQKNLRELIGEAISGQFILFNSEEKIDVLESQFSDLGLFDWSDQTTSIIRKEVPEITVVSPRIRFGGMLSYKDESMGINLQGLTSDHLQRLSSILNFVEGKAPQEDSDIMISESFAEVLEVNVGDTLVLLANNRDGYLSDDLLVVSGIFKTSGLGQFLIPIGYLNFARGKTITGLQTDEFTEILINFKNLDNLEVNQSQLENALHKMKSSLKIANWSETSPLMNSVVKLWVNLGHLIKVIFIIFSFLIVMNIVIMITNNRKKEIGTMLAFGYSPFTIINSIALEYIIVVVVSVFFSGFLIKILCQSFLSNGIPIPWEELQAAYLSTYIFPELGWKDLLLICFYFSIACYFAVWISLHKLPKAKITELLRVGT
ncbi:ABC transporter permease [Muricauda sp. MAR_2010_75]|uniref:ABC transporter permease n=1 Tax=Allomuricauda sp. MAR_2010_75 TaxID=1250232 RepID=UPI000569A4D0|nr:FtsX-like permease family protein [Muricauda sp. MAR_2010_75]